MFGNDDWDAASKRLAAFWRKEVIDRPCLQVFANKRPEPPEPHAADGEMPAETYWTDPLAFLGKNLRRSARTAYLGEALPVLYPNAEHVAAAMGSGRIFGPDTIWIRKSPGKLDDLDFSHVTPEHPGIRQMAEYFERLAGAARRACFVGFPHMGNAGDTLARMRGYGNLCVDLMDDPDRCFYLEGQILRIWKMAYELLVRIVNRHMPGSCGWLPAWHPGRCALVEFDFCALISPELFKRYVPLLAERASFADHAVFHLDGPGALKHLDTLLAVEEIGFVQWEPGAGSGGILDWLPLLRKIQSAGKGLYVGGGPHCTGLAKSLLKELRPEGLMIPVRAETEDEARFFLDSFHSCLRFFASPQ